MNPSIKQITRRIIYLKVLLSNLAHSAFEAHFWPIPSNCVLDFTHDHPNNIVADSVGELPFPRAGGAGKARRERARKPIGTLGARTRNPQRSGEAARGREFFS